MFAVKPEISASGEPWYGQVCHQQKPRGRLKQSGRSVDQCCDGGLVTSHTAVDHDV